MTMTNNFVKPNDKELTLKDMRNTVEGDVCEHCGNKWELKGVCTTCWREKVRDK